LRQVLSAYLKTLFAIKSSHFYKSKVLLSKPKSAISTMSALLKVCFLLLGSLLVCGKTIKEEVDRKTESDSPKRFSWYRFPTEKKSLSRLETSEEQDGDSQLAIDSAKDRKEEKLSHENKDLLRKEIYSRAKLFISLVSDKAEWVCYSDVGLCNGEYTCSNGICQPNSHLNRMVPHHGRSRAISVNEDPNKVHIFKESKPSFTFKSFIDLKGADIRACFDTCRKSSDCHGICGDCIGFVCV